MKKIVFCLAFCFVCCVVSIFLIPVLVRAQEEPLQPPSTQPIGMQGMGAMGGMPRMNPAMLLRMREQMTFELQQTQRTLGFIDPSDTQLTAALKEQQAELANQLKEVNEQLKAQGIPVDGSATPTGPAAIPTTEAALPTVPKADDPTLTPGGLPQPAVDPNLLIQQRQPGLPGGSMPPGMGGIGGFGGMQHGTISPEMMPGLPGGMMPPRPGMGMTQPTPSASPTEFDQDQAWSNSPWTQQPSKELNELKQTVDSLRRELAEMKTSIKALETQIQLLNRNILLSQPVKAASE